MMSCLIPSIIGLFLLAFLPNTPSNLWPKYAVYIISATGGISGFLPQTLIPSNIAGRTKKTVVLVSSLRRYFGVADLNIRRLFLSHTVWETV